MFRTTKSWKMRNNKQLFYWSSKVNLQFLKWDHLLFTSQIKLLWNLRTFFYLSTWIHSLLAYKVKLFHLGFSFFIIYTLFSEPRPNWGLFSGVQIQQHILVCRQFLKDSWFIWVHDDWLTISCYKLIEILSKIFVPWIFCWA
jgi:hypothetical protein